MKNRIAARRNLSTQKRSQRKLSRSLIETLERRQLLSLVVDVRLASGSSGNISSVGQVVNLEIWATAKGPNGSGSDEELQTLVGSLLSTNVGSGAANGTLKITSVAPFNALGSTAGAQTDLDGDGDLDVGSNTNSKATGFFAARGDGMISAGTVSGNGKSFKLATATFTVTTLKTGGTTNIAFRPRQATGTATGALWIEDGQIKTEDSGSYSAGSSVSLTRGTSTAGSISGIVYNDADKDNVFDGNESGIGGATVYIDSDKDGVKDAGEPSTVTDAGGNYGFGGLAAGSYRVRQVPVAGFNLTSPAGGSFDQTLSTGQNVSAKNFANQPTGGGGGGNTASIAGVLWSDTDKDGVIDTGETKLSGKKMFLDTDNDGKLDTGEPTATTNASGEFKFSTLAAGTYRVRRSDTPAGYGFSTPASGVHEVVLTAGQTVTGKNFGAIPLSGGGGNTASIAGILWSDTDKDGVIDAGEPRLSGKKMFLDTNKDGKLSTGEPTATTNTSGEYKFSSLAAGTYRVRRSDTPAGYGFSTPSSGYHEFAVAAGQAVSGKNFGAIPLSGSGGGGTGTGSIAGIVFSDSDKDGILDTTDTRLSGKKMFIDLDKDGKLDAGEPTATTNASGEYKFSNLAIGTYRVRRADLPGGYKYSTPTSGYHELTLTAGQNVTGKNFGAVPV